MERSDRYGKGRIGTRNPKNGMERGGAALPVGFQALSHNEILYFMYHEKGIAGTKKVIID